MAEAIGRVRREKKKKKNGRANERTKEGGRNRCSAFTHPRDSCTNKSPRRKTGGIAQGEAQGNGQGNRVGGGGGSGEESVKRVKRRRHRLRVNNITSYRVMGRNIPSRQALLTLAGVVR